MANNRIQRIIELILDPRSARKSERDMQDALKRGTDPGPVRRNLERFGGYVKDVGRHIASAAAAVSGYVLAFTKLGERGTEVLGVQRAFNAATGDADTAIQKLRKATGGLINDYELMVNFNRALSLGAAQNVDDFGKIAAVAIDLGRALGIDANKAMEDLVLGISRGSKLILDNLGIIVDGAITVDKVMAAAKVRIDALGGSAAAAGNMIDRFKSQFANLRDEVAKFIAQSDTLRIAFFEASNLLETLVLALQSEDMELVKQAFRQVGAQLGTLFAASFFEAVALAVEKLFPNLTKLPSWVPLIGVFTALRDTAREAADAGFAAAEAWTQANEALRRQMESAAELEASKTPPGEAAKGLMSQAEATRELTAAEKERLALLDEKDFGPFLEESRAGMRGALPGVVTTPGGPAPDFDLAKELEGMGEVNEVMLGLKSVTDELFGSMKDGSREAGLAWIALAEIMQGSFGDALGHIAKMKTTEMLALALEEAARGIGALATGNFAGAAAHASAVAKYGAAAAAWRGVGAIAGAGGDGGGGSAAGFGVDAGGTIGRATDGTDMRGAEINIFVNPFDADDPEQIRVIQRTVMNAQEQWGNVKPTVRRYRSAP